MMDHEPPVPATTGEVTGAPARRRWGRARWAVWLPEVLNASIVALVVTSAATSFSAPTSAAEIQGSLLDTYEVSAWGFLAVCVLAVAGIAAAALTSLGAQSPVRRRIAVVQIVLLLACVGLVGWQHHQLMKRTTDLTGQTFGGFP